jgi:hypothetical protein
LLCSSHLSSSGSYSWQVWASPKIPSYNPSFLILSWCWLSSWSSRSWIILVCLLINVLSVEIAVALPKRSKINNHGIHLMLPVWNPSQ